MHDDERHEIVQLALVMAAEDAEHGELLDALRWLSAAERVEDTGHGELLDALRWLSATEREAGGELPADLFELTGTPRLLRTGALEPPRSSVALERALRTHD